MIWFNENIEWNIGTRYTFIEKKKNKSYFTSTRIYYNVAYLSYTYNT